MEPQNCISDPDVEEVVLAWASQTGKTEVINNGVGYFIDQDPSPILMVQPTLELGEAWSKDRLTPMARDTPCLREKLQSDVSRDGNNTIRHKNFPGGHITIAGANSPASLAMRPIRVLILDEEDRFPKSAGKEGDPRRIAQKRTANFWNRKIIKASSPTKKGSSNIEEDYERSDKRRFHVPCPQCREKQVLQWKNVKWPKGEPEKVRVICEACGYPMEEADKGWMLAQGEWIAEKPFTGIAGFHLSALYSPWVEWRELAVKWLDSQGKPDELKVFINTDLAETWDEDMFLTEDDLDESTLQSRAEPYELAPAEVLAITAGVDTQEDRFEVQVIGYGLGEEAWVLAYEVIHESPATKTGWQMLDDYLETKIPHALFGEMGINCVFVDSGGHHAEEVYLYCKRKQARKRSVLPVRGSSTAGQPIIAKISRNNRQNVKMVIIGTEAAKDTILGRLANNTTPGPGFVHFPKHFDEEYYKQLNSERAVETYTRGRTTRKYVKRSARIRNEALDTKVYAYAAFKFKKYNLKKMAARAEALKEKNNETPVDPQTVHNDEVSPRTPARAGRRSSSAKRRPRRKKGFVNSW